MNHQEENSAFTFTYSARQQEEIKKIRNKYDIPEESNLDKLRRLDASAERKTTTVALTVGIIGILLLGCGMSLSMTELGITIGLTQELSMIIGILIGIIGIIIVAGTYPLYKRRLKKERERIAPEIIRLTDELMK